jgi:hypothetical protein
MKMRGRADQLQPRLALDDVVFLRRTLYPGERGQRGERFVPHLQLPQDQTIDLDRQTPTVSVVGRQSTVDSRQSTVDRVHR